MRRLKIALLSRWYAEEHRRTNGTGTVQELAEAVAALGHEIVVLTQSREAVRLTQAAPGQYGQLETWLTPREKRRGGWTSLRDRLAKRRYGHRKVISDALDLRDFLAARAPFDVLWAQCEEPDGLVAALASQLGAKLPPTLTQIYALRYGFAGSEPVFRDHAALGAAFSQATRIIANSELVAQNLASYADAHLGASQLQSKTHVVYHNLQNAFLAAARATEIEPEANRIFFLGALNEKKGALVFLEAMRGMTQPGLTFAIAGGFTEKNPPFDHAWKEGLAQVAAPVELLGRIPGAETIAQIRRAAVVVLPSLFDEFSRALVEALALGRPVVTTETVGAATFVRNAEAGLVVPPGDAGALRGAILEVLRHHARYLENARFAAPRLAHELSPHAIALQIARHLSEITIGS
jgi:glycosyltransferase involved in cell wall biosynthesis